MDFKDGTKKGMAQNKGKEKSIVVPQNVTVLLLLL